MYTAPFFPSPSSPKQAEQKVVEETRGCFRCKQRTSHVVIRKKILDCQGNRRKEKQIYYPAFIMRTCSLSYSHKYRYHKQVQFHTVAIFVTYTTNTPTIKTTEKRSYNTYVP